MSKQGGLGGHSRRLALQVLGWLLVVVGVAALFLPGPGLLALAGGLAVLSQQYEWADRRLEPVQRRAFQLAEQGVSTWPRIALSALGAVALMGVGVVFGLSPPTPSWWPLPDSLWLPGGWGTGSSFIVSGIIALVIIGYSIKRFR